MAASYYNLAAFRTVIAMRKHGFGRGEYKYYANPIPALIWNLRQKLYPQLAPIANRWSERLGSDIRFPPTHDEFLDWCHAAGQTRPTPLILQYVEGDYNCLHQDIYGDIAFPLQVAILLSEPEKDFTGGEFVLTEQRPGCRAVRKSCRSGRATAWFSRLMTVQCRARAAIIASRCGTVLAASVPASGIRWA